LDVLLTSKLRIPSVRRGVIGRPDLVGFLADPAGQKLTVVEAPAGWGKTTLLAEWSASQSGKRSIAWLSLDAGDNDPTRFWTYVVHALRPTVSGLASHTALLEPPGLNVCDLFLPCLLEELTKLEDDVTLVLDDYHLITNADIHDGVAFLVDYQPPTVDVVMATRVAPPLALARLRARGQLRELRADQLRFSAQEAAEMLNRAAGLALTAQEVAVLHERTEGWAAGLYLAALSLRGRDDPDAFIKEFAGDDRHVVDYLTAEVLDAQPDETRAFLLRTSVLERLCGPLCDALTEATGSARTLRQIERANLFVTALDTRRHWYRYHHLLADLLRHELQRTEPDLLPVLHRRASAWYAAEGSASDAIHHATAAGELILAADLISEHWTTFLQQGLLTTVAGWLDALPGEAVGGDARLCMTRAWIAINVGRVDELDRWIAAAEGRSGGGSDSPRARGLAAAAGMLRCIERYLHGDVTGAIESAAMALDLERDESSPWRSVGCPVLGVATFWGGHADRAVETLQEAMLRSGPAGNHLAVVHALSCLATIHAEADHLGEADRLAKLALQTAEQRRLVDHWATTMSRVALGRVLEQSGHLEEADATTGGGVDVARSGLARVELGYALLRHAEIRHALGDYDRARELLREGRQAVQACTAPGILADMLTATERRLGLSRRSRAATVLSFGEELSGRERAVLRLLPSRLSQREIADALSVSANTVKSHTRAIYRKLNVSTREEAVARARQTELI
jgi:LuxR family maltose regulon positive regulatory protein